MLLIYFQIRLMGIFSWNLYKNVKILPHKDSAEVKYKRFKAEERYLKGCQPFSRKDGFK